MKIEFKDVNYTVSERQILKAISFVVEPGDTRVFLGSSGSGKTTILRLLLGLITPQSGQILADGEDITKMSAKDLNRFRKRLAVVFQHSALFDSLTVEQNVGYRLMEEQLLTRKEIEVIVSKAIEFVDLADAAEKMPSELSGGMKKRVALARALASGAEVILFDEPTAGLDPINTANITRFITHLRDQHTVTCIVVTHDLHQAFAVADSLALLDEGELIFEGTGDQLRRSKDRRVVSFVSPSTRDLVSSAMDEFMGLARKRLERLQ